MWGAAAVVLRVAGAAGHPAVAGARADRLHPLATPWLAALAKVDYRCYVNPFMYHEPELEAMTAALRPSREYLLESVPPASLERTIK